MHQRMANPRRRTNAEQQRMDDSIRQYDMIQASRAVPVGPHVVDLTSLTFSVGDTPRSSASNLPTPLYCAAPTVRSAGGVDGVAAASRRMTPRVRFKTESKSKMLIIYRPFIRRS